MYCLTYGSLLLLAFCSCSVTAGVVPWRSRVQRSHNPEVREESHMLLEGPIHFPSGNSQGSKLICRTNPNTVNPSDVKSVTWTVIPDNGQEFKVTNTSSGRITVDVVKTDRDYINTLIINDVALESYRCEVVVQKGYMLSRSYSGFRFADCDLRIKKLLGDQPRPSFDLALPVRTVRPAVQLRPSRPLTIDVVQPDTGLYPFRFICRVDPVKINSSNIKRLTWFINEANGSQIEITGSQSGTITIDPATKDAEYERTLIINQVPSGVYECRLETKEGDTYLVRQQLLFN